LINLKFVLIKDERKNLKNCDFSARWVNRKSEIEMFAPKKDQILPKRGHKTPEGTRSIALLFF
jgi:hypothetical protein